MSISLTAWPLAPHGSVAGQARDQQFPSSIADWLHTVLFWVERRRQRRQLGELAVLNDHLLKDIGVSREDALREAAKPFWR